MGVGHSSKASCWCRLNPSLRRIGAFTSRSETSQPEAPHRPIATAPPWQTCWYSTNPPRHVAQPADTNRKTTRLRNTRDIEIWRQDPRRLRRRSATWEQNRMGSRHLPRSEAPQPEAPHEPSPRHPVANMSAPHEPATTRRHKQKNHTPVQYLDERQRSTRTGPAAKPTPATLRTVETPGSGAPECFHRETNQLRGTEPTRSGPAERVRSEGITQTKADSQKSFVTRWET